jgi:catechol 2,3-dioxygenase-like lactoylglutathione lyase family enzyme
MATPFSRTGWAALIALSSFIAGRSQSCVSTAHAAPAPLVRAVGCIGMTVSDAARSAEFFERVLSFQKVGGANSHRVRVQLGRECLDLRQPDERGRPVPADARSNDRWFQHVAIIVSDLDRAYRVLQAARVEAVSAGPQRLPDWNPNAAGIRAYYFRDADRHVLEILQFPEGKGEPRWHATDRLFLGIDHTAITVADTEASLRFYRDALGLRVAGASENWGPEQERLNAVPDAHLRITTLRAAAGPGVELLEYLTPRDGRPYPQDERPADLIHWQTAMLTADLSAARSVLSAARLISSEARAFVARDPDGHAVELLAQ